MRAVLVALAVLGLTAALQALVFVASGSVALLADLVHNGGDAATAIPLGIAFALRSSRAERWAGYAVLVAIFLSACVAGYEAIGRLIEPREVDALVPLALAGAAGFSGNWVAAVIRARAGRRLGSAALIADSAHARADAYVSLAVVASAAVVAAGLQLADPLIGACHHDRDLADHVAVVAHDPRRRAPALTTTSRFELSLRRGRLETGCLPRLEPADHVGGVQPEALERAARVRAGRR